MLDRSTFRDMTQLRYLDISSNLLRFLSPVIFRDMINLHVLRIQGNRVATTPEGLLANLRNLEELELSDYRLTSISSDTFNSLVDLTSLNLAGNRIASSSILPFICQLRNLIKLNISRNDIFALSSNALRECRQLVAFDMSHTL